MKHNRFRAIFNPEISTTMNEKPLRYDGTDIEKAAMCYRLLTGLGIPDAIKVLISLCDTLPIDSKFVIENRRGHFTFEPYFLVEKDTIIVNTETDIVYKVLETVREPGRKFLVEPLFGVNCSIFWDESTMLVSDAHSELLTDWNRMRKHLKDI
jgi:hypothetical protein